MRTLVVGALAATLVGCSCFVSPQSGLDACAGADGRCFEKNGALSRLSQAPEPDSSFDQGSTTHKEKTARAAKTTKSSSAHAGDKTRHAGKAEKSATTNVATAEPAAAAASPPPDPIDPVVDKAKIAVAVKLEDPASAIFSDMNRGMRKNTLGQSVDTICGHVKSKKASDGDIGDRPFLYLVKDDEAYVADASPKSAASTAYRNICN